MPTDPSVLPPALDERPARTSRRAVLRSWARLAGLALAGPGLVRADLVLATPRGEPGPAGSNPALSIGSESARLRAQYDAEQGSFRATELSSFGFEWLAGEDAAPGPIFLEGVRLDGQSVGTIDGSLGLELIAATSSSVALLHTLSGLRLDLECVAERGNAIVHRLLLTNARDSGTIRVERAATVSLRLRAGDQAAVIGADDTPKGWEEQTVERLPAAFGNRSSRSADGGVYPMVRLERGGGEGIVIAVSSATTWRVDLGLEGARRVLRAGEERSDLALAPGESARLPEVVTLLYRGGRAGAVAALHQYLEAVSAPPPRGWRRTPPSVFNTWFAFGVDLHDRDGRLRKATEIAAAVGIEVVMLDAGWYLGSREPGYGLGQRPPDQEPDPEDPDAPAAPVVRPDEFSFGLGTWVEDPARWTAAAGTGGSPNTGLRNFSDFVHGLDVRGPDGEPAGTLRFGLWVEPERYDPGLDANSSLGASAVPGTPLLDFSRPEVVESVAARLQRLIDTYRVDYLKVDANHSVQTNQPGLPSGHFWTRWSAGFEALLATIRAANPELYLEHSAAGLKRYWIGLPRLVHSTWLDDDVDQGNVERLLTTTDLLLLPRQKTVLVVDDLTRYAADENPDRRIPEIIRKYWGGNRRNGGTFGFSSRLDTWDASEENQLAQQLARESLATWKRTVRGDG